MFPALGSGKTLRVDSTKVYYQFPYLPGALHWLSTRQSYCEIVASLAVPPVWDTRLRAPRSCCGQHSERERPTRRD